MLKPGLFYLFPNGNFLDLNPYQAGYADNDEAASFGPCTRNHYLFHYVISGAGTLMKILPGRKESPWKLTPGCYIAFL